MMCRKENSSKKTLLSDIVRDMEVKPSCLLKNANFINRKPVASTIDIEVGLNKRKINVLSVDDDQINLIFISNYLLRDSKESIFDLKTANHGVEALKIVNESSVKGFFLDVILMDCNMPIMDGYEDSRTLKEMMFKGLIPDVPIIAIRASVGNSDKEICLKNGMDFFPAKPLKKTELLSKIEIALRRRTIIISSKPNFN